MVDSALLPRKLLLTRGSAEDMPGLGCVGARLQVHGRAAPSKQVSKRRFH